MGGIVMKHREITALAALLLMSLGCPVGGDDDDDHACDGTFGATFNGNTFSGSPGQVCAIRRGDLVLISAVDADLEADLNIHIGIFEGPGTYEVKEFHDYGMTGHDDGESYSVTEGTLVLDTWSDPTLTGSFDVEGLNADSTLPFDAEGTFEVQVEVDDE
jgi:hypothetical protein